MDSHPQPTNTTPFHAVRFLLRAKRDIEIPGQQAAMLYALICNANKQPDSAPAFPHQWMLDAPEQTRTQIARDQQFAFGATIWAFDSESASQGLARIVNRLGELGDRGKPRSKGLGGNFHIDFVSDLVAGTTVSGHLAALPATAIDSEIQQLHDQPELTLVFSSPMRVHRPRRRRRRGRSFLDDQYFDAAYLLRRIIRRLGQVGIQPRSSTISFDDATIQLLENRLVWVDMGYGGGSYKASRKTLGGLMGRVRVRVNHPHAMAALVWGQYARVGKNTAFGFGRFRIEELGDDPLACPRATGLLDLAWQHPLVDRIAMKTGIDSGEVEGVIQRVRTGDYRPDPVQKIRIGTEDRQRQLSIPSRRDRLLQRLVLETIAPGLDQLFESSSFAWRRGLGRHSAARAVKRAYRKGFEFAIAADFDQFFDSIDHRQLWDRLSACLADVQAVALIRKWVEAVSDADPGRGILTGAPLSPLLGNLFLDRFDEAIRRTGGKLVRYGDDFLVLFRSREAATAALSEMMAVVSELELTLNSRPEAISDFSEDFEFLGFQFSRHDKWIKTGTDEPRPISELGWFDASQSRVDSNRRIPIPGETGDFARDLGITAIVGPDATHLEIAGSELRVHHSGGRPGSEAQMADLEDLVVLGSVGFNASTFEKLLEANVTIHLADERARLFGSVVGESDLHAEAVTAQVNLPQNAERQLELARRIVAAKVHNYRQLARCLERGAETARRLEPLLERIEVCPRLDALLGLEGAAAAVWFSGLGKLLGNGFLFRERVAPRARDPVNVMLNIAYTLHYRLAVLAIRASGLCGSIGILHQPQGRYQSLAADMQESFRFLADRAVIEASRRFRRSDFRVAESGPYPLVIQPEIARQFHKLLWEGLHREIAPADASPASSYLVMLGRQVRGLRRHLLHPDNDFQPFRLP